MAFLIPENLRSRRDVPPSIGSLAKLLSESLDESATVWYEPLFDVEGDRPDLVVLIPDTGILIIDVLQNKAAAVVAADDGLLTITEDGERRTIRDPLTQAARFAADIMRRAALAGIAESDLLPVSALGVFSYVDSDTARTKGILSTVDRERCLFRDDLDRIHTDFVSARQMIAKAMFAPLRDLTSEEAERTYRALIHPDTVLTPIQMSMTEVDAHITPDVKALDRQQESLAKTIGGGHRVIRGVAGSGKTVVLVHRARLLAALQPKSRVLVTCYNRSLAGWLERQLERYGNVRVKTLDSSIREVLEMGGAPAPDYEKESSEQIATRALAILDKLGSRARSKQFDHVLIDEAQDFGTNSLRFARLLLRQNSDSLLVVADAAQSIYKQGFTWKDAGIEAAGRTKVLKRNYRNTSEILDYAWTFLSQGLKGDAADIENEGEGVVHPEAGLRHGPLPLFRHHGSPDEEVLDIAHEVRSWLDAGESPGDIAILYGSRFAANFAWVDRLRVALDQANVPWYWPTDPNNLRSRRLAGSRADAVMICTIYSAKGLEFKNVILCAFLDDRPTEDPEANRRLIYVGMTRAQERLVLTASGNHPYIADLERGPARS